ncbi:MAG: hypothetical protein V4857_20420 [Pseudomonadota bacterium]
MSGDFTLWLEFELSSDWIVDPEVDFFNMLINFADGSSYALNVWTYKYLLRARAECESTGEHLGGAYMPTPDLLVERLDRCHLEAVVADLIRINGLNEHWKIAVDADFNAPPGND